MLRALASIGIFAEDADHRFSLTPIADHLRSDIPNSLRSFAIMAGAEFYQSWGNLLHSTRTGEPGFQEKFGVPFFRYMTEHPDRHAIYDAAMMIHGIAETEPMLIVGGRERTEDQYRRLFSQAGLNLSRIVPTAHEVSIVEGVRAA